MLTCYSIGRQVGTTRTATEGEPSLTRKIRQALSRIRGPWLYAQLKGPAEGVKVLLQMIVGVTGSAFVIVTVLEDMHGGMSPTYMGRHVLMIISASLAVAASLELAYTLFTPGPDEAVDPLLLGISAVFLYLVSKLDNFTWSEGLSAVLFAVTLTILFGVRQYFIDGEDVQESQSSRLAAFKSEVQGAMEEPQVQAALDLLLIAEFAWHDRYHEIGLPEEVRRDILQRSHRQLERLITLIRAKLEDPNALPHLLEVVHEQPESDLPDKSSGDPD